MSFSGKLIIAFTIVSLLPLIMTVYLNDRATRYILEERANQSLTAAATETAITIDEFLRQNRKLIQIEAQLPTFVNYLLTANQTPDFFPAITTQNTLNNLQRKDTAFITSYALLDETGRNRIDTNPNYVGRDESQEAYFVQAMKNGLPQISAIRFDQDATQFRSNTLQFCFSSPVRASNSRTLIGVLRMCYKSTILQQLIVQNNGLAGPQSFAALYDDQAIRLAHGLQPNLILKAVMPLPANKIEQLQQARRLPILPPEQLSTALPELAERLRNAQFETLFTVQLKPTDIEPYLANVEPLREQPWVVLFAQPRSTFAAPVDAHITQTVWVTVAISTLVVVVALVVGQRFASRIRRLTEAVVAFSEGEHHARAFVHSNDEVETLARKFNQMAEQVGSLLQRLAYRTQQMEAEIDKRKQTESALKTSEVKYRRIFEDSKDVILVTTQQGRVLDVNPAISSILGYTPTELKQISFQKVYADPADRLKMLAEIEAAEVLRDYETQFRRKDGTVADVLLTSTIRRDTWEDESTYLTIFSDVTAKKQVERERIRLMQMQQELALAQLIQANLLLARNPDWPNLDLGCYTQSAQQVGGDFYTYHQIPTEPDWYGFAVGDVSGKGMPAALLMAVSLTSFQALYPEKLSPAELLRRMDMIVTNYTERGNQNCAAIYAQLQRYPDGRSATLTVANAGGIAPIIKQADGSVRWVDVGGLPLGTGLEADYQSQTVNLQVGDSIILSSDGLVEAFSDNGELFGFDRLEQLIRQAPMSSAQATVDYIKQTIFSFSNKEDLHDDLTVLVVKV